MPILDPNQLNNTLFEPVLNHRFILYIDGIPSFLINKCQGIGFEDGEVTIDHINTYFKTRAKRRWNDVSIGLYYAVSPSGAQSVMEWAALSYELVTGRAGYATMYWKDISLNVIDPVGSIISEWVIQKAYIKNASSFGSFEWSSDEYSQIELTLGNSGHLLQF